MSVAMDCPYTRKGEELSPGNLLEGAEAGCMVISMWPTARLSWRSRLPSAGSRKRHPDGSENHHALTFNSDHSLGAARHPEGSQSLQRT